MRQPDRFDRHIARRACVFGHHPLHEAVVAEIVLLAGVHFGLVLQLARAEADLAQKGVKILEVVLVSRIIDRRPVLRHLGSEFGQLASVELTRRPASARIHE